MPPLNKYVEGRQQVGHIGLTPQFSYIEVPEGDANRVMQALNGVRYKGREVRCNDADQKGRDFGSKRNSSPQREFINKRDFRTKHDKRQQDDFDNPQKRFKKDDWMKFLNPDFNGFKGEEPDFSEEGWARRRPKKKK